VQAYQDEPFGGLPNLCYARLFEDARAEGVIVLLDGQGMDEQWAGYDYYLSAGNGRPAGIVQGTKERPVRPEGLMPEFRALAECLSLNIYSPTSCLTCNVGMLCIPRSQGAAVQRSSFNALLN